MAFDNSTITTKSFKSHSQHTSFHHSPLDHHGKRGVFVSTPNLTPIVVSEGEVPPHYLSIFLV